MEINQITNLIQAIIAEHQHAYATMARTLEYWNKNQFCGAYMSWLSTKRYLECVGLPYQELAPQMEETIEYLNSPNVYQPLITQPPPIDRISQQ